MWWICGAVALSIHFRSDWRSHSDVDIALRLGRQPSATIESPPADHPPWASGLRAWIVAAGREGATARPFRVQPSQNGLLLEFHTLSLTDDAWRPSTLPRPEVPWNE